MKGVIDLETKFSFKLDAVGKEYSDYGVPYNDDNRIVLGGAWDKHRGYLERSTTIPDLWDGYDTIIGHNVKYDLLWLRKHGLEPHKVKWHDTMLREFISKCGAQFDASGFLRYDLGSVARRRVGSSKPDLVSKFWKAKVNTNNIPHTILHSYLKSDVANTANVYASQYNDPDLKRQQKVVAFAEDIIPVLAEMEYNGCAFNYDQQEEVEAWLNNELQEREERLVSLIVKYFKEDGEDFLYGFTGRGKAIDSPQHMSSLFYGIQVKEDKRKEFSAFAKKFKPWRRDAQASIDQAINDYCQKLGFGLNIKPKATWLQTAQPPKGVYIGSTGFSAGSKILSPFLEHGKPNKRQQEIVRAYLDYNQAKTWKTNNYNGFMKGLCDDSMIHGTFNQTGTVTLRLSCKNPPLQTFPRKGKIPLKDLVCSRFEGGKIVQADFGQLEFRVVGWLSGDSQLIDDVTSGFDIHTHTAKLAFGDKYTNADDAGKNSLRQEAKSLTFAFQYGAMPKTKVQQAIYDAFYGKYTVLAAWQESVICDVIRTQEYVCPMTGKVFKFHNASYDTRFSWATKAKNYPVQYLSSMVTQAAMRMLYEKIVDREDMKLILQVHDSIVVDAAPEVTMEAAELLHECMTGCTAVFERYFGNEIKVPLSVDIEMGDTYTGGESISI